MERRQGFSLIELIVVIVILGVIAVVAAPRFLNLSDDAKANTMLTVGAAMESALTLLHSQAVIAGQGTGDGDVIISGVAVPLLDGYPAVDGSDSFAQINAQVQVWFDIDSVGKTGIIADPNAALVSSIRHQVVTKYIFSLVAHLPRVIAPSMVVRFVIKTLQEKDLQLEYSLTLDLISSLTFV